MKRAILIFAFIFFAIFQKVSAEPLKINELVFDNSDNIIFLKTKGEIEGNVEIKKSFLKNPDRVYIDISNSVLTIPKKSYTAKHSVFNNIKISQFTTEPMAVRIVLEYNKKFSPSNFSVNKSKDSIFIKTGKSLTASPEFKTVYSNTKNKERTVFYQASRLLEDLPVQTPEKEEKALKIPSRYYLNSITKIKNGIVISGIGKIGLLPPFALKEPERMVFDLDDTIVNPNLRNKSFPASEIQISQNGTGGGSIDMRETLKIGQNSQNVARLVITGENAKDYRVVISPDSKSIFLTKRSEVITSKISDDTSNLIKCTYQNQGEAQTLTFQFDDSIAFDVFEENSNFYFDIDNLNIFNDTLLEPVKAGIPNIQTVRLAADKFRFIFPDYSKKHINLMSNADNTEFKVTFKPFKKEQKQAPVVSAAPAPSEKSAPKITNLYTVALDAGHGGDDVGATRNGIYEKDITLKISKMLEKDLKKKDIKVYMIREKDQTVSLADRSIFSNEKRPDVFVSVHVNSSINEDIKGIETHWWKEDSKTYAQYVHDEMKKNIKTWNTTDRGLFKSQFYVINHTDAPAILCEIGFISNKDERGEIIKNKRQEEIAQAIADGIYNYLKAKK